MKTARDKRRTAHSRQMLRDAIEHSVRLSPVWFEELSDLQDAAMSEDPH